MHKEPPRRLFTLHKVDLIVHIRVFEVIFIMNWKKMLTQFFHT
jgi:hypothetical protein